MHNPLTSASNRILRLVCPEILQNLQSTSMVFLLAVSFIPVTPWGRYDGNWPYKGRRGSRNAWSSCGRWGDLMSWQLSSIVAH